VSDHYQGMLNMRSDVRNATRDQLITCLLELLDQPEINQNAHLLATISRHTDYGCVRYAAARSPRAGDMVEITHRTTYVNDTVSMPPGGTAVVVDRRP
jgi:hypothetical protein